MLSVAPPSSTGSPIASSQAPSPSRDDAVGAPPGAAPTDCLSSPLTAFAPRTEPGSVLLVHPGAVSSSSLAGPFRPSAIAGAMRRVSSASDSGVGAGVACESMTLTSLLPAAHPQARCSPRRWQARSGLRSSAMQGLPTPALSSSAAAADAPPAVAATTSGAVSLQTRNAGPSNQAATPLASSYSSHDSDAASPSASHTGAHRTTAGPTHAEGRDVAGALAANLAQVDVSVMSGGCSAPMRPSSHTSPSAAQDVPVYLSATTSDAACTTRSSTQLMLAAAPTLAATANSSASPYTSTVWWAFTTPPFRHSPQVRYTCHSTDPIGMGTGSGGRLSATLPGYIAAGTAAASDAAESVEARPRLTGTLSSSSSLPSSSLPVYSPSRAGSSAAVPTAGPPSMPSVNSVAAGVGNAGSGVLLFPLQASVPALRSSNPEDEAAAAELVRGQQRQRPPPQQRRHQASIGVPVDVSAVLDSREETGGTDDDHRHRQSRPRGSTSSSNYATHARQQGPSLQPPESSGTADSEDKDQPARQNSRRALDDPKIFMCDTESNAPGTFLMRCEDEGSFVPESVRVRRDVDRTAYHAKAPGGNTANHSLVPGFAGFDALDDAVAARAPVTAVRGVTVQDQGESVPARSHSSSLLTFSQELQRTLPPSAVITASDHYRRLRQQATVHLPPSQASEAVDVEGPDTAQHHCSSPAAHRMHLHFSRCCSEPPCEAANSTRLSATTPPLRLRAGVPLSVLPPRSSSGATQPPPTTPPAGEHERDRSVEEEVEDAAIDSAHSGETAPFLTAHSSSSSVTDSSSRSPATTSVVQQIHSHHTAFVTAASSFRTHPPPPAPVTAPSAAASTTPLESPALPSWSREKVQRLATPPLAGSGLLRLKLSATAPAAASMAQGRSPRTPGSQRESHLMSHVRVALIDARSVRSHLDELRALLPKHRTGAAGATTAQDITGAIAGHSEPAGATRRVSADTQDRQHTSASSAADVRARSDEAGEIGEMLGGEDSADIVHCTTAMSPLNFSLLQNMLRDRKADGIGEGCGGCRNSLRARAGTGKASSQLQKSQGLHRNGSGVGGDGSNDGGRSPATTLSVRGLYTSSLNAYRHQRLTRLTEQHLKSLWLGVSAVAKSVCGVAVEQCVEMDLIQGPALMDGQVLRFPSDTAAAAASAAPSLASLSFGASLQQQLQCARPPSPSSTASTASPNSQGPLQPSGATVSAQDGEATATKKASRGASKPPPPADLPDPMPSFHFSEAPLTAAPAEREAVAGGVQASATAATAEATVQRLASTKRDNSPLGCHRDSQRRCLDESAPLDSAMAGCNGCAPWPLLARTAVSATAASDSTITCTHGEGDARINSRSSAVAPTSLTTRANASTNTNVSTVVEHPYAHSDCYRSGDRSRSCRHHSTTSSTLLSKWSNAPTSGIIYIHNTPANLSSTTTLPSALSNNGSSSGSRMSNTPSTSFSARGGSGGYVVGTAASSLSGLPRPTASTTATTAGGGQTLYTLPSTLLQLQQQLPQHGSSSQSAPSASVDGAAPPSSSASPPVATVTHLFPSQHQPLARGCTASASASAPPTALPQHSSSSLWHSEAGGSSCPLAGSAPGPMWMLPPPSPASPPPPAAVHRGAAAAASGASGALVVAPTVPSALPSPYGATSSGVDAGASALQGLCTRSSGLAPATPFTSPSGSTLISSLLVAMPNPPPLKAPFIKVQREEVAADTAPDSHSNARVSGAQRAVAAFSVSTSGTAAHARGEFRGQSPVSSALLLTSHERPDGGGAEARTGTAAQLGSTAAVAREGMARGGTNGVSNSVGAAPALPPAIVSPYGMLAEGELCVVAPIHDSTELLAHEIHGSGDTPTSSGAKPVMMPGSPLAWRGRLEARSSSSVRRSAATEASVTTAGLVPLTTNDSSEGVEELSEPFSLMRAAATPSTRGRMGVLGTTTSTAAARAITSKTTATTTTTTNTALPTPGNHPSLGGSMGGVAMHFSLPSTSTPRRQPQLQHALPFSSHAGSHQQDVCLHDIRSHATTATEAQGGEAASTALPSATEQPLAPSQQHRTRSRDESVGRRDVQALPLLRSSLPLDGTTPASAVSANGDQQQADNGESDGTDAAVKASHRLAAHAAAEGPRAGKAWNNDFSTGAGSAKLRDETGTSSGFAAGHDSTASPPSPRQRQDEQDAGSVAAHPRAASAASSSLSYTTISASTADATPAAVTAISVSGTRVPSSAPSATLPAPLRAELQPGYGGDGASLTRPMNTAGSALNDLGDDEDTNTVVKRSGSSESSSSASHTPSREALLMDGTRHRQLHAVLPWAQLRPPPTPTLNTASLTMYSANRADALLVRAKDMEREVDVISALMCATSLPARPGGLATGTDGSLRPSSPTSTLPARAEVVHNIPATEAEVRKTDALVMQSKGEDGTTDTPGPLAPSLALRPWATRGGRHVGVCTDSTAVALDTEHSRDLTATAQSSDKSPMAAYAGTCSGDDRGEAGEAKRIRGAVSADELAASDSEDGRDLLSLYVNSDAHDLPSSPRRAAAYQQALQQQQYHQRHLMQTWSSIFTISSSGHSAATTSSLRTAITGVALSASVAALGSRLNTSSTMSSGTPTALASVAEVILGIGAAGSVVGGGSAGGVPSGHAGAIPSIGTAATATAAAGSAAASSFTVTMIAPTTAAAANSTWTPNSTVTLSSDSASAAGFTSPSTLFGTTVSSSASYSLSPERCGIIVSGGAGGGVTAEVHSVSPTGGGEGAVFLPWCSASAPAQTDCVFPVAVRATGADAAAAGGGGGGGAACDADFDALRLDAAFNSASASAESTQYVLSRLKPLPHLPPPHNYPFLLPEVTSPCLRDDDGFGEDDDDADACDYTQDVDVAVLLGADSDFEPEERHRATAPVRGGSDHSSRVETPCCDGAGGAGPAYDDSNAEDHGAVVKWAASSSQHHGNGKVDVGALPTQPPPDSCSNEGPTLTTVAASMRTATTDDGGAGGASLYAAVVSRTVVAHASRMGEVGRAEDDSTTEGRTSSVHLSARSLGISTARLSAPAGAGPATTAAAGTSSAAASIIEGNEDMRVVSLPRSGEDVPIAPSWPLLCTNTASAAPRSPRIVSNSPLRLRSAVTITAGGDALVVSTATTAMAAAERERAGAQTNRSASRPHHLSGGGSALIQDGMPASNSNSGNYGGVCGRLFSQKPNPPEAALEEGGSWAEVAATTVSEDTANALVTPGLPAMQHSSQRQTSSCAPMVSSVTSMAVGDSEGFATLRDGGDLDAGPAVTKAVRAEPTAFLFDDGGIEQPNRKYVGHRENMLVGEGGASTAVEGRSDRPGADRSISIEGDAAALSHSAETAEPKRRHDDRRAVDTNAVLSGAAPDAGHASRITSTPLAMTPALRAAGILGSDGAVLRLLRDAARSTVRERTPSETQSESRGPPPPPPPPLPPTQFSIPSYYLAQCEDGLADVAGSLHGWHATTSAFFSGADTAAAPGQTRGRSSSPSSRSSDLYISVSALARRRAQQRAFYNDAGLSDTAAPSHTMATTADTPLPASAMPGLSPRLGATADHSENAATPPTSPSAAAGATHNDRLVALMRAALRLTDGESGAC
ncbi:hypothetical protein, unknown function [Leishmania infantum JPCM5]|uniref:Uncharacterized protein n=2 Tax=Leishmania infantum TaxID=5671 RepID=E9AG18_LEIIN|nr:hypothetical protein, unknown function [Leishmania infantum JPCM5]CBZ08302.1 hypothetical protein, unknown function [Leishmania infantum JPCM5]|eukprot:XP_003392170.1 hypothetical protein, unknown function [Leishmania infantum JPCM5]